MAEIVDEILDEFPHKPGGMIDRFLTHEAAREAAEAARINESMPVNEPAYKAVKTAPESPETVFSYTWLVQPGARQQIMRYDPYRQRATVSITTPSAFGLLCRDEAACVSASAGGSNNGFFHGVAQPPLVIMSRAQLWFYNSGGVAANVSVLTEVYAAVTPGSNG